jgi:CHASE2 domain-containing sensor protein
VKPWKELWEMVIQFNGLHGTLLNNFFSTSKSNSQIQALVSSGFVVGCVFYLVGGALSMFGPSVFSFVGTMVTFYYVYTRGGEDNNIKSMRMFALAVFYSFACISSDMFAQRGVST